MWLLELLLEVGADLSRIGVGVMPFGTGNDLARCLGFGGTPPRPLFGEALLSLRSHVERYLHAHAVLFDVWEVTVSLSPEGRVTVVEQSAGQGHKKDVTPHGLKLIKRMNNYCSVGLDAYVGHSFDKRRTSSQTVCPRPPHETVSWVHRGTRSCMVWRAFAVCLCLHLLCLPTSIVCAAHALALGKKTPMRCYSTEKDLGRRRGSPHSRETHRVSLSSTSHRTWVGVTSGAHVDTPPSVFARAPRQHGPRLRDSTRATRTTVGDHKRLVMAWWR
mmetsp:Transcript_29833/g.70112  ORF Transcript_29833/g.70112 Transcript_29833/m.70112 type:complete len:274 (+) Transcript_29833:593-1414(+)